VQCLAETQKGRLEKRPYWYTGRQYTERGGTESFFQPVGLQSQVEQLQDDPQAGSDE
jgi:hypothetical protein